jgi:uncharacterized protein (DUF3820 family)
VVDLTTINLNAPMPNVVPFGKYKGRSIIELQETDPGYLQWLVAQDWFREKFITLHQTIINRGGEPSETPEHNYYQALFLDEKFAGAVFDAAHPGEREQRALQWIAQNFRDEHELWKLEDKAKDLRRNVDYYAVNYNPSFLNLSQKQLQEQELERTQKLTQTQAQLSEVNEKLAALETQCAIATAQPINPAKLPAFSVEFETEGADVQITVEDNRHWRVGIEIKPAIGDDYPAVLRQMKGSSSDTLYIVTYTGAGASLDQVKKIFKASGIAILMHADFAKYVGADQ